MGSIYWLPEKKNVLFIRPDTGMKCVAVSKAEDVIGCWNSGYDWWLQTVDQWYGSKKNVRANAELWGTIFCEITIETLKMNMYHYSWKQLFVVKN